MADPGLVGRDSELQLCAGALDEAARSRLSGLLFEGAPGIGKSSLLDAVVEDAEARGLRVLRAACDEPDAQRPFNVFVELLGLDSVNADVRFDTVASLIFETARREGETTLQIPDFRVRITDELDAVIDGLALDGPLAIVLDDLQWSDASSLVALTQVLKQSTERRVALIAAHRPTALPELARIPAKRAALHRLADGDVRTLLARLNGASPAESLVNVARRAGGNPLFITELVGTLRQDGFIEVSGGAARATTTEVPESVHATIRRRMSAMPQETLSALTVAAVLSEPFSLEDIAVVTGVDGVSVYATLHPAVDAAFLRAVDDRFDFRHDVVREALYLDLPLPARRAFHLKVARALATAGAPPARVARHFALGAEVGDVEAAAWLRRAGAELTPYAPATGVELLQQALTLVGRASPHRCGILADLLPAAYQAGEFEACDRAAKELLGAAGDLRSRLRAQEARFGMCIHAEQFDGALAVVDSVLALPDLPDPERALWVALHASTLAATGDVLQAIKIGDEALRLGREAGVPYAVGRALTLQAAGARALGDLKRAAALADESLQQYTTAGPTALSYRNQSSTYDLLQAYIANAPMLIDADRFDDAEAMLRSATIGLADLGQIPMLLLAHRALLLLLYYAGRWDEAFVELETARSTADKPVTGRVVFGDPLPEMLARMDEIDRAVAALDDALPAVDLALPQPGGYSIVAGWAYLLEARDDRIGARERLAAIHEVALTFGVAPDIRAVTVPLVRHLVDEGRTEEAEKAADVAEAAAARAGRVRSVEAAAAQVRAIVTGDAALFGEAIEGFRSSPRAVALAVALEDAGNRVNGAAPSVRAAWLEEARALFDGFGAVRDARRVASTLRALGVRSGARGARGRPSSGWDSLTPSEIRVVELLSEGLTNPQIGERLYLSRKTVATHVSAALRKLGVSSRTEIAAIVARRSG